MEDVDEIDAKLLSMLAEDSRQSYTDLAKTLNLSDVAVKKRIDKLMEKKIITNFSITVDQAKLGKALHSFLLLRTNPTETDSILAELRKIPDIGRISSALGPFDIVIEIHTSKISDLKRLTEEDIGNLKGVIEVRTLIMT